MSELMSRPALNQQPAPVMDIIAVVNLPLLDVPLSRSFMRPSIAVPRASVSQTASD